MKEFNVREFNRLCAELLGFVKTREINDFCYCENSEGVLINQKEYKILETNFENRFTEDWNWIMVVVEKIVSLDILSYYEREYDSISETYKCKFYHKKGNFNIVAESESEKDAVIDAIWQFLNWYNQNKSIS
jgi:hypothetical protein